MKKALIQRKKEGASIKETGMPEKKKANLGGNPPKFAF